MMEKYQRTSYNGALRETGTEKEQKILAENRLSKKGGEVGINLGFWQLIEVEIIRRQPTLLIGAMDSIIIIIIIIIITFDNLDITKMHQAGYDSY
jgi:hypothetical protein